MKTITLLIPAYNEEAVLPLLFDRLNSFTDSVKNYDFEFLFVNDGSSDKTIDMIKSQSKKDHRVSYINLSRNFGKEIAMIAGIDHVKGDAMVIIDADLQDPPELISEMIKYWEEGYDDVYAKRRSREGETWFKLLTANTYYWLMGLMTPNINIPKNTGDFRLLDRRCIDALKQLRESERYTKGMFSWVGFKKKEIEYDRDSRAAGEIKQNYKKLFNLAFDGITSFSSTPLRISTVLGMAVSLVAFLYLAKVLIQAALFGDPVVGYPSLMAVVLFLGGFQLLSLGIIGEYIARIFSETKRRPLYLIEEYHASPTKKTRN